MTVDTEKTNSLLKCLAECNTGTDLKVIAVNAGRRAKQRLANLGIVPGVDIKKERSAVFGGPVEISVKGSKIVLGRELAAKVMVYQKSHS